MTATPKYRIEEILAGLGASCRIAYSIAKTKLMITKRILITHGSQSLISPVEVITAFRSSPPLRAGNHELCMLNTETGPTGIPR